MFIVWPPLTSILSITQTSSNTFDVKYQSITVKIITNGNHWNEPEVKLVKANSSLVDINREQSAYLSGQVCIDQSGGRKCSQTC